jgi:hypothetical protein
MALYGLRQAPRA